MFLQITIQYFTTYLAVQLFYGMINLVKTIPPTVEWHGCHSKNKPQFYLQMKQTNLFLKTGWKCFGFFT